MKIISCERSDSTNTTDAPHSSRSTHDQTHRRTDTQTDRHSHRQTGTGLEVQKDTDVQAGWFGLVLKLMGVRPSSSPSVGLAGGPRLQG